MKPSYSLDPIDFALAIIVWTVLLILALLVGSKMSSGLEPDYDGDGVPNVEDNCPCTWNPSQADIEWVGGIGLEINYDGHGNACDGDWADGGGLGSHQDGIVGLPDFNVFVWCRLNGDLAYPYFPIAPMCIGSDMDQNGVIDGLDHALFVRQLQRGMPGELPEECGH